MGLEINGRTRQPRATPVAITTIRSSFTFLNLELFECLPLTATQSHTGLHIREFDSFSEFESMMLAVDGWPCFRRSCPAPSESPRNTFFECRDRSRILQCGR